MKAVDVHTVKDGVQNVAGPYESPLGEVYVIRLATHTDQWVIHLTEEQAISLSGMLSAVLP